MKTTYLDSLSEITAFERRFGSKPFTVELTTDIAVERGNVIRLKNFTPDLDGVDMLVTSVDNGVVGLRPLPSKRYGQKKINPCTRNA